MDTELTVTSPSRLVSSTQQHTSDEGAHMDTELTVTSPSRLVSSTQQHTSDEGAHMDTELTVTSPSRLVSSTQQHASASQPVEPNHPARQRESRKATATTPAFLSNLGKATLRGIRKCPQCGVYNGTRGLSCKNKACGITLRDGSACRSGKKGAMEVVKVVIDAGEPGGVAVEEGEGGDAASASGGGVQVFSVCQRGRGATPAQLGFVELVPTDTAIATGDGATLLTRINLGRCFMPSCRQGQKPSAKPSAGAAESPSKPPGGSSDNVCVHIKQATECMSLANPLTLKSSILDGLSAPDRVREELWRLATESPGPLVQRVSADRLVVKCHSDADHPLGLLHLTVGPGAGAAPEGSSYAEVKGRGGPPPPQQEVFQCSCRAGAGKGADALESPSSVAAFEPFAEPCLHFHACVCAFASDEQLASDFAAFIDYGRRGAAQKASCRSHCAPEKARQQPETTNSHHKAKRLRPDEALGTVFPAEAGRDGVSSVPQKKPAQRKIQCAGGQKTTGSSSQPVDEHTVTVGFQQWLSSVTERIHQTMHYQFDGKPEPLVYHIPQEFFQALQHRLSLGSKKRRLPNTTTAFVRTDALPVGSFSKYTWQITNLLQIKRIFDTPELPLELTQSFVKNIDGSYSPFRCPEPPCGPEGLGTGGRTEKPPVLRPMELRTFLKVGTCTADQKEPVPFVIEWIPDVLPRCRVGELRLRFEYGHQQGGRPEYWDGSGRRAVAVAERAARGKAPADHHAARAHTLEVLQVVV